MWYKGLKFALIRDVENDMTPVMIMYVPVDKFSSQNYKHQSHRLVMMEFFSNITECMNYATV